MQWLKAVPPTWLQSRPKCLQINYFLSWSSIAYQKTRGYHSCGETRPSPHFTNASTLG
jgi:hypothetical protein